MAYAIEDVAVTDRATKAWAVTETMLANGLSLRKASAMHDITPWGFLRAVGEDVLLSQHYERARAAVIDKMADEVMELADAPINKLDNGATDTGLVRQRQLQVDTRKWFLAKLAPKVYGDRMAVEVTETRISISGALAAAEQRVALIDSRNVQDVQDVQEVHQVQEVKAKKPPWPRPKPPPEPVHDKVHTIDAIEVHEVQQVQQVQDVQNQVQQVQEVHTTKAPALDARAARLAKLQAKLGKK